MAMLQNHTTITRATVFAFAMAAGAFPCSASSAVSTGGGQVFTLDAFHALRQSSSWNVLRAKLQRWKSLPLDWDGNDGIAPDEYTISACQIILNELESVGAPFPTAAISGDGEVVFEWAKGDGYASISHTNDGHLIAFLREPGTDNPVRVDQQFDPQALTSFLNRIGAFA